MEPNAASPVNLTAAQAVEVIPRTPIRPAPGYRATEFYLTVALIVIQLLFALNGLIPPEHAAVYATITGALYKMLRTALKAWAGHLDLQAELASVNAGIPPLVSVTPVDCAHQSVTATEDGGRCNSCGADMTFDPAKRIWVKAALILFILSFAGCTTYNLSKGTGSTWGDSQNFTQTYHGDAIHWDAMSHSAVWDANGRWIGNITSGAAEMLIANGVAKAVTHGGTDGVQLIAAAMPPAAQKFTSRRTNRATPTPTPMLAPSHSAQ